MLYSLWDTTSSGVPNIVSNLVEEVVSINIAHARALSVLYRMLHIQITGEDT